MNTAQDWYDTFMQVLQHHDDSLPLKEAAAVGLLDPWTKALSSIVVDVCGQLSWSANAKGHPGKTLPISRHEYLSLDVMAFDRSEAEQARWPFPVAVFELENSAQDDKVAYSLWKVLCVQAQLRVVFCYRSDPSAGNALVHHLSETVIGSLSIQERTRLSGETMVIVGSRAEESTFPYGFFRNWTLDKNTGHFSRL